MTQYLNNVNGLSKGRSVRANSLRKLTTPEMLGNTFGCFSWYSTNATNAPALSAEKVREVMLGMRL